MMEKGRPMPLFSIIRSIEQARWWHSILDTTLKTFPDGLKLEDVLGYPFSVRFWPLNGYTGSYGCKAASRIKVMRSTLTDVTSPGRFGGAEYCHPRRWRRQGSIGPSRNVRR